MFLGGGLSAGLSIGLMAGWVVRPEFSEDRVQDLITEVSFTGTVVPSGLKPLGGAITWAPSSGCQGVEIGIADSSGVSGTYATRLGNVRNLPKLLGF